MLKKLFTLILLFCFYISFSQCPRNEINCTGKCGRFIDNNMDKYCDYSTVKPDISQDSTKNKDTLKKLKSSKHLVIKNNNNSETKISDKKGELPVEVLKKSDSILKNEPDVQPVIKQPAPVENEEDTEEESSSVYDVIPILLIMTFLYSFTYFISRKNFIRPSTHRKIWNVILLATFMVSALFGLFLAIQINYNFALEIYKTLLYWHVEFGIAMTIISIFHVFWHLSYFLNIFKSPQKRHHRHHSHHS